MHIEVFENFTLTAFIQSFVSFEQERCYQDAGQFTLTLNSLEHKQDLQIGNILLAEKDAYIIENVHQYSTGTHEMRLEITGRGLASILDRRVVGQFTVVSSKTYEAQVYDLIQEHFTQPKNSKRKIDCLHIAAMKGLTVKPETDILFESKDCLEIIKALCEYGNLGFRIRFFPEEAYFLFEVYEGKDLTEEVFFSEEYGNISDSEIYEQTRDYKNVVYAANAGMLSEIAGDANGLFRREMIANAENAATELKERCRRSAAECSVMLNKQFIYKQDWDVGDAVTFVDNQLGFLVERPILSVKEVHTNQMEIEVNFGDKIPTIFEKLGKR